MIFLVSRLHALLCAIVLLVQHNVDAFVVLPYSLYGGKTNGMTAWQQQHQQQASTTSTTSQEDAELLQVLYQAVETKRMEPSELIGALRSLETQQRQLVKQQQEENDGDDSLSQTLRTNLVGDWQLMLVTDKRLQSVIYLPVRNIFSIRQAGSDEDAVFQVENAIRLGDWVLLSFLGTMEYNMRKRQGLFDYNRFVLFNGAIDFGLKPGEAERMVSTVEKRATPKTSRPLFGAYEKPTSARPFFNFFIANDQVAAARGSVGGFALWKRVA